MANQPGPAPLAAAWNCLPAGRGPAPGWDLVYAPAYNDLAAGLTRLPPQPPPRPPPPAGRKARCWAPTSPPRAIWSCGATGPPTCILTFDEPPSLLHLADLHCLAAGVRPPEPWAQALSEPERAQGGTELLGSLGAREETPCGPSPRGHPPAKAVAASQFLALGRLLRRKGTGRSWWGWNGNAS